MNFKKVSLVIIILVMVALLSAACGSNQATTPAQNQVPAATQGSGPTAVPPTAVPTKEKVTAPEDVPIMPDAYSIEVPNQLTVNYRVAATTQDVVDFYEKTLPENGWDLINNPDSVVGSMAQMTRSKANGDRINFSIQYNTIGEFSVINIFIIRAK